jgi:hypothetical protein
VIIIVGVGILGALIFGIVFIFRRRRQQARVSTFNSVQLN